MYIVESPSVNPYINLAIEEYLFTNLEKHSSCLMLWQNDNTIVIGNYQNPMEEVNMEFAQEKGIRIARRLSGGGAVYHDLGNLNYTFITDEVDIETVEFQHFILPLIQVLKQLGIAAEFSGRNDVLVDGKKICGNSQRIAHKRVLHHGCILLNANQEMIGSALNPRKYRIVSNSTKSVKSRTADINSFLKKKISVKEFKTLFIREIEKTQKLISYQFSDEATQNIIRLSSEKYSSWEWNYGKTPAFAYETEKKFPGGYIKAKMNIGEGVIKEIRFEGDFFMNKSLQVFEKLLIGKKPDQSLFKELEKIDAEGYFRGITNKELYELLTSQHV